MRPGAVGRGGGPAPRRRRHHRPRRRARSRRCSASTGRASPSTARRDSCSSCPYFDALRASDATLEADFAWLRRHGIDGVRIFPNWWRCAAVRQCGGHAGDDTLMAAPDGALRPAVLARLKAVLAAAGRHGLIVDLSFARETVRDTQGRELSPAAYADALAAAVRALGPVAARDDRPPERGLPEPAVRGQRRRTTRRASRRSPGGWTAARGSSSSRQRGRGRALHLLRRRRLSARRPRRPRRARAELARSHAGGRPRAGRARGPPRAATGLPAGAAGVAGRAGAGSGRALPRRRGAGDAGPVPRPGPSTRGPRSSSATAVRWRRRWTPTSARCSSACGSASTLASRP